MAGGLENERNGTKYHRLKHWSKTCMYGQLVEVEEKHSTATAHVGIPTTNACRLHTQRSCEHMNLLPSCYEETVPANCHPC